jgi:hypothetical protein
VTGWIKYLVLVVACTATYKATDWMWQAKWNEHIAQDAQERADWTQQQRDKEHGYELDRKALLLDFEARLDLLSAARSDALRDSGRLQEQLATTTSALLRTREAAKLAGVNAGAAEAALVLSKLYGEAVEELRRVAGTADEWYEQSVSCAQFYEKVRAR